MTPDDLTLLADWAARRSGSARARRGPRALQPNPHPMPSGLTDRLKFEITLAALNAEVAELQELTLAGARADTQPLAPTDSVTFTSSRYSLMVAVSSAADDAPAGTVRIDGDDGGRRVSRCASPGRA